MIVDGKVLIELKSVDSATKAHKKQILTYLRLTGLKLGYLLNPKAAPPPILRRPRRRS